MEWNGNYPVRTMGVPKNEECRWIFMAIFM